MHWDDLCYSLNILSDQWDVGGTTIETYEDHTLSSTQKIMEKATRTVEQKMAKKLKMHDVKEAT